MRADARAASYSAEGGSSSGGKGKVHKVIPTFAKSYGRASKFIKLKRGEIKKEFIFTL